MKELLQRLKAFLLVNHGWRQIVVKNAIWAGIAEGVVRLLKLALILLVVRYFGPTEYGKFAFAFSFAAMFGIIFDSGLMLAATREFSVDRANEQVLPDIILMRLGLGLLGMAAIAAGMLWVTEDPTVRAMMLVLGGYLFVAELLSLAFAIVRARQKMEYECLIRVTQGVILVLGVGLVVWKAPSVMAVSYAYLGSAVVTLAIVALAIGKRLGEFRFRWDVWRRLLRVGFPLALAGGMGAVYMNIDSVMLGYWGQTTETGWYNVAAKLTGIVLVPVSLLALVMFPAFTVTSRHVDGNFRRRWDTWTVAMIGLGAFFACVILGSADGIVEVAFGGDYRPAGLALRILVLSAALVYVYAPSYQALIMFDQQTRLFWCLSLGALINVVLNSVLIPRFSLYGAAWATVVTHVVILAQLFRYAARYTPVKPVNQALLVGLGIGSVSGFVAYVAIRGTSNSLWSGIPAGVVTFVVCFWGLLRLKQALEARLRPSAIQGARAEPERGIL